MSSVPLNPGPGTVPATAPAPTREERLALCANRVAQGHGVPPFSQHVQQVIAYSVDPELGLTDLSRTILKDVGLSSHVLRVANSSMYNHSGRPILNVAHCVSLLGGDAVREHVGALRFIEQFARQSPGLRELAALSLFTANHGRQVASLTGYPRPEEAYICSLFANLGEILSARYCPAEYARVVVAMREERLADRVASLRHLGFSWHELAARVSAHWNMPAKIRLCIEARDQTGPTGRGLDASLTSIAAYSVCLTDAIYRKLQKVSGMEHSVVGPDGRPRRLAHTEIDALVAAALEDTAGTMQSLRIPADMLQFERQAEAARVLIASGGEGPEAASGPGLATDRPEEDPAAVVENRLRELAGHLQDEHFEIGTWISDVLEAVHRAGRFDRTLFALVTPNRESIIGRLGYGEEIAEALSRFSFRLRPADALFAATFARHQDVLVRRDTDWRFDQARLVTTMGPQSFGIFPVVADRHAVGCLYVDSRRQNVSVPDWLAARLRQARDLMAAALARVAKGGANA